MLTMLAVVLGGSSCDAVNFVEPLINWTGFRWDIFFCYECFKNDFVFDPSVNRVFA